MSRIQGLAIAAAAALVSVFPAIADAFQADAEYLFDGSRLFWFLQISDTHVDSIVPGSEERVVWALNEGIQVVAPDFVVNTGDLTDSTDGVTYGTGPHEVEWIRYRALLEEAGLTSDYYYDLPGNHDQYGDGQLELYRQYSMWGAATGHTQPYWSAHYGFGTYFFLGVATTGNDGAQWPFDHEAFTWWELESARLALEEGGEDADLIFLFGHHDYTNADRYEDFVDMVSDYGPPRFYGHGHSHDHEATLGDDGIIRYRIDSLGQGFSNNFAVWAVDANAVNIGVYDARHAWPAILVTAPVAATLLDVDNPNAAPVPNSCEQAPVRALVFDLAEVVSVEFRWDEGDWHPMEQRLDRPQQWRGIFDATKLEPGLHRLSVHAQGSEDYTETIDVEVIEGPCELGEEDPDLDELGNDEGLEDAQDMGADLDGGRVDGGSIDQGDSGPDPDSQDLFDGNPDSGPGNDSEMDERSDGFDSGTDGNSDGSIDGSGGNSSLGPADDGCGCGGYREGGGKTSPWTCLVLIALLSLLARRDHTGPLRRLRRPLPRLLGKQGQIA